MDFNNINDIIDTDDHGNDSIAYLARKFFLPHDVFEDIHPEFVISLPRSLWRSKKPSHIRNNLTSRQWKSRWKIRKKRRAYYEKGTVEETNWYRRYLATPHRIADVKNPCHPKGIEFRRNFSVPHQIYVTLLHLTLDDGWYNPNRKDAGDLCSDIRLLLLGALHTLSDNASKYACQTNTNVSADAHRRFNLNWWRSLVTIRDNYIGMPENEDDLETVATDFDKNGLPGCCGSMDVVYRGWDK